MSDSITIVNATNGPNILWSLSNQNSGSGIASGELAHAPDATTPHTISGEMACEAVVSGLSSGVNYQVNYESIGGGSGASCMNVQSGQMVTLAVEVN